VFGRTDASPGSFCLRSSGRQLSGASRKNFISALGPIIRNLREKSLNEDRLITRLNTQTRLARNTRVSTRKCVPLCDAFAAGLNYYLRTSSEVKTAPCFTKIEPVGTHYAFIRYNYFQNGFAHDRNLRRTELQTAAIENDLKPHTGSNGWVVGPSKSASGHALLFINPHLPFFGPGQVYEGPRS
jgi:acyl-homoserine lactone acylase PvdQ